MILMWLHSLLNFGHLVYYMLFLVACAESFGFKSKVVFFWLSLIRCAVFGRCSELGLCCFVFSISKRSWNGMIHVWLRSLLNFGRFGILYAIFGGLCRDFWL